MSVFSFPRFFGEVCAVEKRYCRGEKAAQTKSLWLIFWWCVQRGCTISWHALAVCCGLKRKAACLNTLSWTRENRVILFMNMPILLLSMRQIVLMPGLLIFPDGCYRNLSTFSSLLIVIHKVGILTTISGASRGSKKQSKLLPGMPDSVPSHLG